MNTSPLKNPIEDRLTVLRLIRHLGVTITDLQYNVCCDKIRRRFSAERNELPKRVQERFNLKGKKTKVCCYPPDFMETMVSVIKDVTKKPKRPRITR